MKADEWKDILLEKVQAVTDVYIELLGHVETMIDLKCSKREFKEVQVFMVMELMRMDKELNALDQK